LNKTETETSTRYRSWKTDSGRWQTETDNKTTRSKVNGTSLHRLKIITGRVSWSRHKYGEYVVIHKVKYWRYGHEDTINIEKLSVIIFLNVWKS
jgi:hypothetical protein